MSNTKNIKSMVNVDWTGTEGDVPFYEPSLYNNSGGYGVSVDTQFVNYNDFIAKYTAAFTSSQILLQSGTNEILNYFDKAHQVYQNVYPEIPTGSSGLYISTRPVDTIKVLVTIPQTKILTDEATQPPTTTTWSFDDLPGKEKVPHVGAYEEVKIETHNLKLYSQNVSKLMKLYNVGATNYGGRVYDFSFEQQVQKINSFYSRLIQLIGANDLAFEESNSELVILGVDKEYKLQYGQISQDDDFVDLYKGFDNFKDSDFVDSNTISIYQNLEELNSVASEIGVNSPSATSTGASIDWEEFLKRFIKYPPALVEHTSDLVHKEKEKKLKIKSKPQKNLTELEKETAALEDPNYKKRIEAQQKKARDFVGDNVIGNLDKVIGKMNSIESMYHEVLDKTGMTYIVRAALRCLALDLPIEEFKQFLLDIRKFTADLNEILKIPVLTLDDLLPTVDIMWDIAKAIVKAIVEAIFKALWEMLKNVIYSLLDNCSTAPDDSCKDYGAVGINDLMKKGGLKNFAGGLVGPAILTTGNAALEGVSNGLADTNKQENTSAFLSNLTKKVSPDQLKTLTAPIVATPSFGQAAAATDSAVGKFFDELSATLTCGETKKVLEGKAPPAAQKVIKAVADNLAKGCDETNAATNPYCILKSLLADQDSINDFFASAGDLIDQDDLDDQLEAFAEISPSITGCLSDKQDSDRRSYYLGLKDVPPSIIEAQNNGSRDRARKRAQQLNELLLDPSRALQDAVPPIYCSYKDGKIVEGLVPQDHASFTFQMKNTLGTIYDGIGNAFMYDVIKVPDMMQIEVPDGIEPIPRVVPGREEQGAQFVNGSWKMINPHFSMAIEQGYKPKPEFWQSEPWTRDDFNDRFSLNEDAIIPLSGVPFSDFVSWAGEPGASQSDQSEIKVAEYEKNGIIRTIKWNDGKEPINKPKTKIVFCPGMKPDRNTGEGGVYNNFQTTYVGGTTPIATNELPRSRLETDRKLLQLNIDNLLKTNLEQGGLLDTISTEARRNQAFQAALGGSGLGNFFGPDRYTVLYRMFSDVPENKDQFSIKLLADFNSGTDAAIYEKMFILDMDQATSGVLSSRGIIQDSTLQNPDPTVLQAASSKEKNFAQFLQTIWGQGESIYTGSLGSSPSSMGRAAQPYYCQNFISGQGDQFENVVNALLEDQNSTAGINSLYEEILRDLMSQGLFEIRDSPFLTIDNLFSILNLVPLRCRDGSDRSLLGLDDIKENIMEQYKNSLCIKGNSPNVTGLGSNKDNAFESAAIFGIIKTTVRVYTLEIVLKTLVTFSELQVEDLDPVFIAYVREQISLEIEAKGYLDEFIAQTLKAYNLVAASRDDLVSDPPETHYAVALDFFIKEEMAYSVNRLLKLAGLTNPGKSLDNLLMDINNSNRSYFHSFTGWIPELRVGIPQSTIYNHADAQSIATTFHVGSADEVKGIKDWGNGSLVLEKYIRVKPKPWVNQNAADSKTGVFDIPNFELWDSNDPLPALLDFGDPTQADTILSDEIVIEQDDDCNTDGTASFTPPASSVSTGDQSNQSGNTVPPNSSTNFFEFVRYGLRLVFKTENNDLRWRMQEPRSDPPTATYSQAYAIKNKTYTNSESWGTTDLATSFSFPVACVEIDANIPNILTPPDYLNEYQNAAPQLLGMLKETDEYKFLFDYCFPLKRMASIDALYNATYVLPYPGLNDVFSNTKSQLRMSFMALVTSGNYRYSDLTWEQQDMAVELANGRLPPGFDFGKLATQFLFGLFKGAGQAFSPNIKIASMIQEAAKKIGPALVATINKAKKIGNRANEIASGDLEGGNSGSPFGPPETECSLGIDIPTIPMFLISLGLLPMDVPPFTFFPIGPPLTPLGMAWLPFFGWDDAPGNQILEAPSSDKEKQRCDMKKPGGPLPNMETDGGDCD